MRATFAVRASSSRFVHAAAVLWRCCLRRAYSIVALAGIVLLALAVGAPSAPVGSTTRAAGRTTPRDQLMEIKIRRARWIVDAQTLRSAPVTGAGQQDIKVAIAPAEDDLVSQHLVSVSAGGTPIKSAAYG